MPYTRKDIAMFQKATGPCIDDDVPKINAYLAEQYQDFKEFIQDELGIDEFNRLWIKFENKL